MPYLAIDTSNEYLSLALTTRHGIVGHDWLVGQKHAELTLGKLAELLAAHQLSMRDIEGIAFGNGPGSFTGLRIACGLTQGLAFAHNIPVLGVSTLEALAQATSAKKVISCIDARMQQVYCAAYIREGNTWQEAISATVCNPDDVPLPDGNGWFGIGSGFASYGDQLSQRLGHQLADTDPNRFPHAQHILEIALPRFQAGQATPASEAQLIYLRDKVALKTSERDRQ